MTRLTIQVTPINPSHLRSHHTPMSPASPINPQIEHQYHSERPHSMPLTKSHPPIASPWLWSCHKCRCSFPIGATRRCLHDGHLFCSGLSIVGGKRNEHAPCSSIFDYQSWRTYASWRRETFSQNHRLGTKSNEGSRGCWDQCDFPSQCRWAPRLATQEQQAMVPQESMQSIPEVEPEASSSDEDGQDDIAAAAVEVSSTISSSLSAAVNASPAVQSIVRMLKSAERRTSHIANLFHPSESESAFEVEGFESDASLHIENGSSFSSFKDRMDKHHGVALGDEKSVFEDDEENDDDDSDEEQEINGHIDAQPMPDKTREYTSEPMDLYESGLISVPSNRSKMSYPRDPLDMLRRAIMGDPMDLSE